MFSEYLRRKRKEAKLSQQELADRITSLGYKCSNGKISYYETNYGKEKKGWSNRPPEEMLPYLAKALGLTEAEIRGEAGYAVEADGLIIQGFDGIDEGDIEKIKSYVKFLESEKKKDK